MERERAELSQDHRAALEALVRDRNTAQKVVLRARIVLLTADGTATSEIVRQLDTTYPTVSVWRKRFLDKGPEGLLKDASRPGRKPRISRQQVQEVIDRTLHSTPINATQWSTRTMAAEVGLSKATIQRMWRDHGLQPHRTETFKLSSDPQFLEKLTDVVGLYLDPPEKAIVFSVDEKSQIQALDRTQPGLPMKRGRAGTMTHDYKRNGTITLFAALNVATGEVVGECHKRHRHDEFLIFLKKLERETEKNLDLHLIVDNYATHNHPDVKEWLAKHERVHLHFTPTSASWLNQVERFFAEITRERIRRGAFKNVAQLESAILGYLAHRNEKPEPFKWTATVDKVIKRVDRAKETLETQY